MGMSEFNSEYYDHGYFADKRGKAFKLADGSIEYWGYKNPTGDYLGAKEIAVAWKKIFNPELMLDAGAGRGVFIAYAQEEGIPAVGFDYSEWAVSDEGRFSRCEKEWLIRHDATEKWPYPDNSFPMVTALDLLEHIYQEDIEFVINEFFRVSKKWLFLQIATVDGEREIGYILNKGDPIPFDTDARTWAGHVTVQTKEFWENLLEREDWLPRRDLVQYFYSEVKSGIGTNWVQNTLIILEKLDDET